MRTKILSLLALAFISLPLMADEYSETIALFKKQPATERFFANSVAYAVFPTIGKGGFVIGGAYGKGHVYKSGKYTGESEMAQVSIGMQIGGQAYSEIIFFQDEATYNNFISGNFEFGADASAVVLTAGAKAEAGTSGSTANAGMSDNSEQASAAEWYKGTAIFTVAKGGLMAGVTVGGQKFTFKPAGSEGK